jgi:hypothetical protein
MRQGEWVREEGTGRKGQGGRDRRGEAVRGRSRQIIPGYNGKVKRTMGQCVVAKEKTRQDRTGQDRVG